MHEVRAVLPVVTILSSMSYAEGVLCFSRIFFAFFFFRIYCYSGITVVVKVFIKDTPSDIPTFYMLTHSYFRGCKFDDRPTVVRDQS